MRPVLLAALALLAVPATAQVTLFESGYVVSDGERVGGGIALATEVENARSVRFRGRDGVLTLGPHDIEGYGTEQGRAYRTVRVVVDGDSAVAFARVVRDGRADLLALHRGDSVVPLVSLGDGTLVVVPRGISGARSMLAPIVSECPGPLTDTSMDALAETIGRFNECVDDAYEPEPSAVGPWRPRPGLTAEVALGVSAGRYTLPQAEGGGERGSVDSFGPSLTVALAARTAWAPRVQPVLELRHTRTGVFVVSDRPADVDLDGSPVVALAVTQVGLGVRTDVTSKVWVEGGLLAGRTSTNAPILIGEQIVTGLPLNSVSDNTGAYLQAAVRPLGPTLHVTARGQFTSLSGDAPTNGVSQGRRDGGSILTGGVGLLWRFGN